MTLKTTATSATTVTAAIYARVSTEEQVEGYSLAAQDRACRAYADAQNWLVVDVYRDEGWSGRREDRPALQRLLADVKAGRVQAIIVHKLDRLARNLRLLFDMIEDFDRRGVVFISVSEQMDFSTPIGRVMLANLGAFAEFYSRNLATETAKGLTEKAESGLWVGPVPLGYRKDDQRRLVPSADVSVVRLIFDLYKTGRYSYTDLADELNARGHRALDWRTGERHLFGRESVRTILKNRAYLGLVSCGGREYKGQHEPLITEELWEATRALRETRTEKNGRVSVRGPKNGGMLTEIVYCYRCGARMWYHYSGDGRRKYYVCGGRSRRTCDAPFGRADTVEETALEIMNTLTLPHNWQNEVLKRVQHLQQLQQQRLQQLPSKGATEKAAIEEKIRRLALVFAAGDIDEATYTREREQLRTAFAAIPTIPAIPDETKQTKEVSTQDLQRAAALLSDMPTLLENASIEDRRALTRSLFSHLWIEKREIKAITPTRLFLPLIGVISAENRVAEGARTPNPLIHSQVLCH
jgi:site-specific DNA recombinase